MTEMDVADPIGLATPARVLVAVARSQSRIELPSEAIRRPAMLMRRERTPFASPETRASDSCGDERSGPVSLFENVNDIRVIPSASAAIAEGTLSRRLAKAETPRDFREIAEMAEIAQHCAKRARLAYRRQHNYGCVRLDALIGLAN